MFLLLQRTFHGVLTQCPSFPTLGGTPARWDRSDGTKCRIERERRQEEGTLRRWAAETCEEWASQTQLGEGETLGVTLQSARAPPSYGCPWAIPTPLFLFFLILALALR